MRTCHDAKKVILGVQGHIIGVDEFLELCRHWKRLTDKFAADWVSPEPDARQTVQAICC